MAIQMQQMTNMVSNLAQMGKEHIRMGEGGALVQATASLGGRMVNWCKAGSSKQADANRAIINKVLDNIKNTEGMGTKLANIAKSEFAKNLESGRPISGMKVAQVLDKVVNLAKDVQARQANFKINSESLLANLKSELVEKKGVLFEAVSDNLKLFGYSSDLVDDAFMAKVEKNLVANFTKLAIKNDASVTPEQVREICSEAARMTTMRETMSNSLQHTSVLCDISSPTASLPTRVDKLKLEAGIKADIPLASLDKLAKQVTDKVGYKAAMEAKQTTPEIAQAEVDKCIKKFLDGVKAVENAPDLTASEKTVLINSIVMDEAIFTKDMAQACAKTMHSTSELLDMFNQRDTKLDDLTAGLDKMLNEFNLAVTIKQDDGSDVINPDIGADQVMAMRFAVVQAYMTLEGATTIEQTPNLGDKIHQLTKSLQDDYKLTADVLEKKPELGLPKDQRVELLAKLNAEDVQLKKAHLFISNAMNAGGALNQLRYAASQSNDYDMLVKGQVLTNLLLLVNQSTPQYLQERNGILIKTVELGRLTMNQAREFMPTGHGKFGTLDEAKAMDSLTKGCNDTFVAAKKDIANVPNEPLKADSSLEQKMKYFGDQFLKDLWRGGITLNGEYIPSTGSNDEAAMSTLLDKVIAFFPNIETASLTTSGLHQGLGADSFAALGDDPATSEGLGTFLMAMIPDINDGILISITDKGSANYSVTTSISKQKAGDDQAIGLNVQTSYELNVNTAEGTVASITTGFDYILS